jgi:hypothetical protein
MGRYAETRLLRHDPALPIRVSDLSLFASPIIVHGLQTFASPAGRAHIGFSGMRPQYGARVVNSASQKRKLG